MFTLGTVTVLHRQHVEILVPHNEAAGFCANSKRTTKQCTTAQRVRAGILIRGECIKCAPRWPREALVCFCVIIWIPWETAGQWEDTLDQTRRQN